MCVPIEINNIFANQNRLPNSVINMHVKFMVENKGSGNVVQQVVKQILKRGKTFFEYKSKKWFDKELSTLNQVPVHGCL